MTAAGLAARPLVVAETEAKERAAKKLYAYVQEKGSDELRRNLEASDMDKWFDGYFRACIPSDDRRTWTCYLIDVRTKQAKIKEDPSARAQPAALGELQDLQPVAARAQCRLGQLERVVLGLAAVEVEAPRGGADAAIDRDR